MNAAATFSIAFFPESVPFFSRFGFQAEGVFSFDLPDFKGLTIYPTALLTFQIYRLGDSLLSLLGGAYYPIYLDNKLAISWTDSLPIGWTVGLNYGGKLDPIPGIFYMDLRYSDDLYDTWVNGLKTYRRMNVTVSIGYQYGFIKKK